VNFKVFRQQFRLCSVFCRTVCSFFSDVYFTSKCGPRTHLEAAWLFLPGYGREGECQLPPHLLLIASPWQERLITAAGGSRSPRKLTPTDRKKRSKESTVGLNQATKFWPKSNRFSRRSPDFIQPGSLGIHHGGTDRNSGCGLGCGK
jgi:hypothetical protein